MPNFDLLKKAVSKRWQLISKQDHLFYKAVDRDAIFPMYLAGFEDPAIRQEHNCNSCKSFFRQWAGVVAIIDGKVVSLWDDVNVAGYEESINNIRTYVASLPITDVFVWDFKKLGVDKNRDGKDHSIVWQHFFMELPDKFVKTSGIDTYRAEYRTNNEMILRACSELTPDAVQTVLDLMAQGSLYRGDEFKNNVLGFKKLQKEFLEANDKALFCWNKATSTSPAISRIRNSAIGTLLINLSEGMDLEIAVGKFEQVVAPTNYKRPTALITPKMIEDARLKLDELGLTSALSRRFAVADDLNIRDIFFTNLGKVGTNPFDQLAQEALVNVRSLAKVEEVPIEQFIKNVVPTATKLEVLLENRHFGNMFALTTSVDSDAPNIFKWKNNFAWTYAGGVADSIKENVAKAGGKVDGVLRFSIQWNEDGKDIVDFDLWAKEPNQTQMNIGYSTRYVKAKGGHPTVQSGILDVDMISPHTVGVENIVWTNLSQMRDGEYIMYVHNYSISHTINGFTGQIEFQGEVYTFTGDSLIGQGHKEVARVKLYRGEFTLVSGGGTSEGKVVSNTKWGIGSNQFHNVTRAFLSPNHWDGEVGNKHYMFTLENCHPDEDIRGFFNEYLKGELDPHRKVFEVLGGKLNVPPADTSLSGIAVSSTTRNHIYFRVSGSFKRTVKVVF